MSTGLRKIGGVLSLVERASVGVAALIVFALMFLVVFDVLGRKLLNMPIQGSIEIASLTLPAVVFLTVAYIQSRNEHVTVDLFTSGLSHRIRLCLDVFSLAIGVAVMIVIVAKTTASAWSSTATREYAMGIVEVPIWPARILVAFGSWLLALRLLHDFVCGCMSLLHIRSASNVSLTED
jgi:TRAP-type mannitol/chloroaromatic compound transport system permease small subunit